SCLQACSSATSGSLIVIVRCIPMFPRCSYVPLGILCHEMMTVLYALGMFFADLLKSRTRLEVRICFSVISSPLLFDRLHLDFDSVAVTVPCSSVWPGSGPAFLVRSRWFSRRPSCDGDCVGCGNYRCGLVLPIGVARRSDRISTD